MLVIQNNSLESKNRELYAKFSKYEFWLEFVVFLGHIMYIEGIKLILRK